MFGFEVFLEEPIMHCKSFKDNSGYIDLELLLKVSPCTKHTNFLFCHFHGYVRK